MKTYQLTLAGFDSRTNTTDHLIKWINAPSLNALRIYIAAQGWQLQQEPETCFPNVLTREDGVDAELADNGQAVFVAP